MKTSLVFLFIAAMTLAGSMQCSAADADIAKPNIQERILERNSVHLEWIKVQGKDDFASFKFEKLCIDGQAYLVAFSGFYASGITAVFNNGKPEQCK